MIELKVGPEYLNSDGKVVTVKYIGAVSIVHELGICVYLSSRQFAENNWTLPVEKPKPKKLYAYIARLGGDHWIVFHPSEYNDYVRQPEYDIEFPLDGE